MCLSISISRAVALASGLVTLIACKTIAHVPTSATSSVIGITDVSIVDPERGVVRPHMTAFLRGPRILSITPASKTPLDCTTVQVDGRGLYLLPGLWDMHVHLTIEGRWSLPEYIAHGVTGVRDMGGNVEDLKSIREDIRNGSVVGPRIVFTGPMIESPAALRDIVKGGSAVDSARAKRDRIVIETPMDAARMVDSVAKLGVDMIKGRDFTDAPTYWAIASAAKKAGLPFVGHAPFGLTIDPVALADSGERTLEHWYYPGDLPELAPELYQKIVSAYVAHSVALDPTIGSWRMHRFTVDSLESELRATMRDPRAKSAPATLLEFWNSELLPRRTEQSGRPATAEELKGWNRILDQFAVESGKLAKQGMTVLAGSDLPFARFPGEGVQDEVILLVTEARLAPAQALAAATISSTRVLNLSDSLGRIAPGMIADLVLLSANPLADITNVRSVSAVFKNGQLVWMSGDLRKPKNSASCARLGA